MLIDIYFDDLTQLSQLQVLDLLVVTVLKDSVFVSIDSESKYIPKGTKFLTEIIP